MTTISCDCGHARVDVLGKPLLRIICHCTLCQSFYQAAEGDPVIFKASEVKVQNEEAVSYRRLRKSPAVDRGACVKCSQPIVEFFAMPLLPDIVFIPGDRLASHPDLLPEPALRIFYDSRTEDANDDLPRHNGYWPSQLALTRRLLPALLR
ncbi:GFA family protein [Congregibacter sp.]|uniref:GFA family protein n=1 Tax=Congregibacter sp. TaxID=2744308 RepID=UPI00385F4569